MLEVQARGGSVACGPWHVHLPRVFGLCGGVRRALRVLFAAMDARPHQRFCLLGEIIHNDTVNEYLRARGALVIAESDVATLVGQSIPGDIAVVPAFGLPEDVHRHLRTVFPPDRVVDTTCSYVRRVWDFVRQMRDQQRTILLHGKPGHAEVRATLSRALTDSNAAALLPDVHAARDFAAALAAGDLARYPAPLIHNPARLSLDRFALANQTTVLCSETEAIAEVVRQAVTARGGDLVPASTVCRATELRQESAMDLCRQGCDVVLVLGGYSSSNTAQLYRLARQHAPTYFIRNAAALAPNAIRHYLPERQQEETTADWLPRPDGHIAILAGASCPPFDIGSVVRRIAALAEAAPLAP